MTKPYATMTVAEQWQWHSDVYAFRRVVLGQGQSTSPCDPEGKWFDADLVDAAERFKRGKLKTTNLPPVSDANLRSEEAAARSNGWASALARRDAIVRNEERYAAGLRWQQEHAAELRAGRAWGFKSASAAAASLGVTATESNPDPAPRAQSSQREMGGES